MSTINSQTVITGNIESNVIDIYKKLMSASTGVDSIYLKAKETLTEELSKTVDGITPMTQIERATVLAQMLGQLTSSISNQAMNTAYAIAKDNKESPYTLAKISVDTLLTSRQADKLLKDSDMVTAQINKVKADTDAAVVNSWNIQAGMIAGTGIVPNTSTAIPILTNQTVLSNSTKYQETKLNEAKVYESWSNSLRASGTVGYTIINGLPTNVVAGADDGLIAAQTAVARRQYDAFDDNMRQHAVNSSAAMLGVLIGAQGFETAQEYQPYVSRWLAGMDYLNGYSGSAANKETTILP